MMTNISKYKPFIFGLAGPCLTTGERELFTTTKVYGFILFARNIESLPQVRLLVQELKSLYPGYDTPIFIDQEGGRVARLKPPVTAKLYPKAEYFGNLFDQDQEQALIEVRQNYYDLAKEIVDIGLISPLAPVCDIRYPGAHDVIGDRSFGNTPEKVIKLASAAIEGIKKAGAIPCIKHLPGHGRALVDSHFSLPRVSASLNDLEATDFKVFKELAEKYPDIWAMSAHIVYTALDNENPFTLSKKGIEYVRKIIGFKGILISDAIEMKALHSHITHQNTIRAQENIQEIGEKINYVRDASSNRLFTDSLCTVAKAALVAGCDLVLHCTGDIEQMTALCNSDLIT